MGTGIFVAMETLVKHPMSLTDIMSNYFHNTVQQRNFQIHIITRYIFWKERTANMIFADWPANVG